MSMNIDYNINKADIINKGGIIISSNDKHELGNEIVWKHKDIKEQIKKIFGNKILYIDNSIIKIEGIKGHHAEWVDNVFEDYPEYEIEYIYENQKLNFSVIIYV